VELNLGGLEKDDNVTPQLMIECVGKLLKEKERLHYLRNARVRISSYYAVLETGQICIPWNWSF